MVDIRIFSVSGNCNSSKPIPQSTVSLQRVSKHDRAILLQLEIQPHPPHPHSLTSTQAWAASIHASLTSCPLPPVSTNPSSSSKLPVPCSTPSALLCKFLTVLLQVSALYSFVLLKLVNIISQGLTKHSVYRPSFWPILQVSLSFGFLPQKFWLPSTSAWSQHRLRRTGEDKKLFSLGKKSMPWKGRL